MISKTSESSTGLPYRDRLEPLRISKLTSDVRTFHVGSPNAPHRRPFPAGFRCFFSGERTDRGEGRGKDQIGWLHPVRAFSQEVHPYYTVVVLGRYVSAVAVLFHADPRPPWPRKL